MLAIQRPRMASGHQPSDLNGPLPFGYEVDPSHELLFQEAPEPPPGVPLLSDNEHKALDSFFEGMKSDDYNMAPTYGEGAGLLFNEAWLSLPPQFMGTTTSFGLQSALSLDTSLEGFSHPAFHDMMAPPSAIMPPPPPPPQQPPVALAPQTPIEQQASADVLAAATLLQNGSLSRANGTGHSRSLSRELTAAMVPPPVGHLRHKPIDDFRRDERRLSHPQPGSEHDNTFTDMMFGSAGRRSAPRVNPPVQMQWGSDASFHAAQGFVPMSDKDTSEAVEQEYMRYMSCLEVTRSAATTRPSSPVLNRPPSPLRLKSRTPAVQVKTEDDSDGRPRKRRKSTANRDSADYESETAVADVPTARKRKSKGAVSDKVPSSEGQTKRRKSSGAGPKQPRENLSEEQKRENHIKSEQKRRTLIKEGFDDLCDLVPGLKGGGFSKSVMLNMAAEWLSDLLRGNDTLREQLRELGGP